MEIDDWKIMRKAALIIFSFLMMACSELIDKPKNLISKDTMADVLAEFAMNEQMTLVVENINLDNATRYTLQQKKLTEMILLKVINITPLLARLKKL